MNEKLVTDISRLLEKHEVHNQVLAIELAILVIKREKSENQRAYHRVSKILKEQQ